MTRPGSHGRDAARRGVVARADDRSERERPVGEIAHGDHLCLAFADDTEQQRVITAYLRTGLRRGERVMYFADQCAPGRILDWLRAAGVDPGPATDSGQLTVTTAEKGYLATGSFDADAMVGTLHGEIARSIASGFTGFRVSGEMSWALRGVPGAERLNEYETKVSEVFAGQPASAICQYDARRFYPAALHFFDHCHPATVRPEPLHTSTSLQIVPSFHGGRRALRVVGVVGHQSAGALASALETALGWPGDITVDMGGMEFLDLAGVRALVRVAEQLPRTRQLHIVDLDPMLSHVFQVVGWDQIPSLAVSARGTSDGTR
ncbi:MEDS domain-containing protein [Streptomyces sp. NPDC058855]|uniref:MEDS domain-containing protein n=1 Tax=Streptomyces sp. NPDC058855 TaxID=3346651 RepID=UPI00369D8B71